MGRSCKSLFCKAEAQRSRTIGDAQQADIMLQKRNMVERGQRDEVCFCNMVGLLPAGAFTRIKRSTQSSDALLWLYVRSSSYEV